jgi:hypothetical protein
MQLLCSRASETRVRRSLSAAAMPLIGVLLLVNPSLAAQFTTASLGGTVTDPSGGAVPAAKVSARNKDTALARSVESASDGGFLFSSLPVGTYSLTVEKAGFSTYVQDGIVLTLNQAASVPVTLKVGKTTEEITVTANAELVASRDATVGQLVDQKRVADLPLNGRQAQSLVFLAAGTVDVTNNYCGLGCHGGVYPGEQQASVNGAGPGQVNYQLDGAPHNDTYLNMNLPFPNPDAVQEFTLQRENMSAEFGGASGGVVNIVSKSGTNEIHGDGFEFLRNGALNARNFFAPTQDTLKRNQFGGSIGGPIKKDRLFYFGTYQGTRTRSAAQGTIAQVPTAAERDGDFSDLCPSGFDASGLCTLKSQDDEQIHDPDTGQPFVRNFIDPARFSPPAVYFLKLIPPPNGPGRQLTYAGPSIRENEDQWMTKIDYVRGRHQISGRYYWTNFKHPPFIAKENILAADPNGNQVRVQNIGINHTFTASPTLLFNTWFGLARQRGGSLSAAPFGFPDAGVKIAAPSPPEMSVWVGSYFAFNTNHKGDFDRGEWTIRENVTMVKGPHELKFGGEFLHVKKHLVNTFTMSGEFDFYNNLSGDDLTDFFLGRVSEFLQGGGEFSSLRGRETSAYAQDNWRVSRRLTAQFGLRWDPYFPFFEEQGRTVCFNPGQTSTRYPNAPTGLVYGGSKHDAGCPPGGSYNNLSNFGPRLGFAYKLTEDGKTSLRGGFGYYYTGMDSHWYNVMVDVAPFAPRFDFLPSDFMDPYGFQKLPNPFPAQYGPKLPGPEATFLTPVAVYGLFQKDFVLPRFGTWNLTLERQLARDWVVRASYVGNQAVHLNGDYKATRQFNPAIYGPGATLDNTQDRRVYKSFSTIGEVTSVNNSHHEALQLNVEKRFAQGLSLLANYTWSKTIDDINWTDPFNRKFDYGKSNDDIAHNFKLSEVWQIPSGHLSGVPAKVLGGWELNTIWTWRGGFPFSIYSGEDNSLSGVGADRADFIGASIPSAQLSSGRSHGEMIQKWFNTSLFATNAVGTFGNSGKNILRGPRFFNTDFGLLKNLKTTEKTSVQFRAEFFNAFNNVNFGMPDGTVTSGTFGKIFSASAPRILQFALKFLF